MNPVTSEVANQVAQLPAIYEPVAHELAAVEALLREQLSSQHEFVDSLVKHGFLLGGKRMRPALLLLSAKAAGRTTREHEVLATVLEMIHTATLVHDDVLDQADLRRHQPTVNAKWSNETSVLLGDYLFTHAFHLASTLDTTFACVTIGRSTNIVCEGELRQVHARARFDLTEQQYLDIIDAKTAELCACCCQLGAHYAGADEQVEEALTTYGRELGIAFQIADDLLDLTGDEARMGKSLGTDLETKKPTLPVIHLLRSLDPAQRERAEALLTDPTPDHHAELMGWLEEAGSLDYARSAAAEYAQRGASRLEILPESRARDVLADLTQFVVARSM